jgi:phosphoribosylglycinamide formyltransferase-1
MSRRGRLKLAVLISGRGSNMLAVAHACQAGRINAGIVLVLSDRADAPGLAAALGLGLPAAAIDASNFVSRDRFEAALEQPIDRSGAELLLLAGFMRILSDSFVQRYRGRLLNIHPSLLPKHKGLHTHRRALVAVRSGDTEQSLAARVLEQEHRLYPFAVGLVADGRLELKGDGIVLDGQALRAPLEVDHSEQP